MSSSLGLRMRAIGDSRSSPSSTSQTKKGRIGPDGLGRRVEFSALTAL